MVLAGPGSGKTTVLTKRIEILLRKHHVPPQKILVITFTRAAASEMKSRFLYRIKENSTEVTFGTFHAVFYHILRAEDPHNEYRLLSESERLSLFCQTLKELYPSSDFHSDTAFPLLTEYSEMKRQNDKAPVFKSAPEISFKDLDTNFSKKKKRNQCMDFEDMLFRTEELFRTQKDILRKWQNRFSFFLIDEFQDIDPVQYRILRMLSAPLNNLFVVGDEDQAIYAFRGASTRIMLDFPKDYPDCKTILLPLNYRSKKEITDAAEKVIQNNKARYKKEIVSVSGAGGRIFSYRFPDEETEYENVARLLLLMDPGERTKSAILTRTHGGMHILLQKLSADKVPFFTKEKIHSLFQHPMARPIFAMLRYVMGDRTRTNFLLFMNTPSRGFYRTEIPSEVDLEKMVSYYQKDPDRRFMAKRTEQFLRELSLLPRLKTPFAMINYFRIGMRYDEYISDEEKKKNAATEYRSLVDEIQAMAAPYPNLRTFFDFVTEYSEKLSEDNASRKQKEGEVMVSTIHASKGLEYKKVFLLDCNERNMPHEKAILAGDVEEERRLFYVGMTRASETLYLFCTKTRYKREENPGRFLKEAGVRIVDCGNDFDPLDLLSEKSNE